MSDLLISTSVLCCFYSTLLAASRRLHILIHNQLIRMIVLGPSNPESDQQRDLLYFLHQKRNSRCVVKTQQHPVPRRSLTAANSKFATSFCRLRLQRNQQLWVPYLLAPTQVTLYPHHTSVDEACATPNDVYNCEHCGHANVVKCSLVDSLK